VYEKWWRLLCVHLALTHHQNLSLSHLCRWE
jgi:hypothetical protein